MGKSTISIDTVAADSDLLPDIIKLADGNSKYLGFYPKSAWPGRAAKGDILVARDRGKGPPLGYVLYSVALGRAVIQQLCVADSARTRGVGRALVDELFNRTQHLPGIRLNCRRDFPAHEFWLRMGFVSIGEKPGRGKDYHLLTCFWKAHEHPSLFSALDLDDKEEVVIDANVFFDLISSDGHGSDGAQVLLLPWLDEYIRPCVTKELSTEINRNEDDRQRQRSIHLAKQFALVDADDDEKKRVRKQLAVVMSVSSKPQHRSDLEHLAITVAAGVNFFVTSDRKILSHSGEISAEFGLRVLDPVSLLTHFDQQRSAAEYEPARLGGSHLGHRRPGSGDLARLVDAFHCSDGKERKSEFRDRLHGIMSNPDRVHASVVEDSDKTPIATLCGQRTPDRLVLACMRTCGHPLAPTVMRHLVSEVIIDCRKRSIAVIEVSEPQLYEANARALRDLGFVSSDGRWVKVNLFGAMTVDDAGARLVELRNKSDGYLRTITEKLEAQLQHASNPSVSGKHLQWLERQLSPLRLVDERLGNWAVPIQPRWARELFDHELAKDHLLPAAPHLALQYENVFYRSAAQGLVPTAPGHVLWYVSASDEHGGPSAIRACSNIDEVVIDVPKRQYANYERFGVYNWGDLKSISAGSGRVLAFRFSGSELFAEQIERHDFSSLCAEFGKKMPPLSMPWRMPTEMFAEIYRRGTETHYGRSKSFAANTADCDSH